LDLTTAKDMLLKVLQLIDLILITLDFLDIYEMHQFVMFHWYLSQLLGMALVQLQV
jgi:hypothetical protein